MMFKSILMLALIALYVAPAVWLAYVALASKWSKEASEKYEIQTKKEMRSVLIFGLVPVCNLFGAYALAEHLWKRQKNTPLHPEGK